MSEGTEENPLRAGLSSGGDRLPEPCTIVIFGASGDLTKRKLVPGLYSMARERLLPPSLAIVGVARRPIPDDEFRKQMREGADKYARRRPVDAELWKSFEQGIFYVQSEFHDTEGFARLKARLEEIEAQRGIPSNRVYYLSVPPSGFAPILENLGKLGMINRTGSGPFTRIIVEKPFGTDLESARTLNRQVLGVADEQQVYRIDHYLGKETVQNLMVFRFANGIFEPLWNNKYVDHVQITGAEAIGIEGRGNYFEEAGILRDMVQNHLFQVMSLTAMEPPVSLAADDLRDEKVKVLKALRKVPDGELDRHVVRAQYTAGSVGGKRVIGYKEETGVKPGSTTETYVALRFFLDSWRWAGVPFYLRSAKAMPKKVTEVALVFKSAPQRLFAAAGRAAQEPNVLAIRIQPDEGISIKFGSKLPGPTTEIHPVNMEFRYGSSFGIEPPEAYERLLLDCMLGDASLFTRGDEVEASWKWITRVHELWAASGQKTIPSYEAGSWGPPEADRLLAIDGHAWRRP
jgi:glucose-6-phosphate 1-dehydrogenase